MQSLDHPADGVNPSPSWCYNRAKTRNGRFRLGSLEACQIDVDRLAERWWTPAAPLY